MKRFIFIVISCVFVVTLTCAYSFAQTDKCMKDVQKGEMKQQCMKMDEEMMKQMMDKHQPMMKQMMADKQDMMEMMNQMKRHMTALQEVAPTCAGQRRKALRAKSQIKQSPS